MSSQGFLNCIDLKKIKKGSLRDYVKKYQVPEIYLKIDLGLDSEESIEPLIDTSSFILTSQGKLILERGVESNLFLGNNEKFSDKLRRKGIYNEGVDALFLEMGGIILRAVRHKTRRNILKIIALKKSVNLYQLAGLLKKDYSRIYRHVQVLEKAGIVKTKIQKGKGKREEKIVEPLVKFVFSSELIKMKLDNFDKMKKELKKAHEEQLKEEEKARHKLIAGDQK
ncbi:ArsR family transcriptional regulator [Candidatus Woesearchaeota archaeon]|nr:ArsR family transcriptional regulator [Candidatus Woesearchaeota archaeon]